MCIFESNFVLNDFILCSWFGVVFIQLVGEKHSVKLLLTSLLLILLHLSQSCWFQSSKIKYKITQTDSFCLLEFFTCCTPFVTREILSEIVQVLVIFESLALLPFPFTLIFHSIHEVFLPYLMIFPLHCSTQCYHAQKHYLMITFSQALFLSYVNKICCSQDQDWN